jgi:hypothetical protein
MITQPHSPSKEGSMNRWRRLLIAGALAFSVLAFQLQKAPAPQPTAAQTFASSQEIEKFLQQAKIIKARGTKVGTTNPWRLTLDDGQRQHLALFKTIDERKPGATQFSAGTEIDFKDSWMFEVAAYEIDKLLGLNMVPATIARSYRGHRGSLQFWMDNCIMEKDRLKMKLTPPDPESWKQQIYKVRLFDNLLYNIDRNLGNLLISPDWKCYMIDHSRTFKNVNRLKSPKDLTYFSRSLMDAVQKLDEPTLKARCGKYLSTFEIKTMLQRRDKIVQVYTQLVAQQGQSIVYP